MNSKDFRISPSYIYLKLSRMLPNLLIRHIDCDKTKSWYNPWYNLGKTEQNNVYSVYMYYYIYP